MATDVRTADVQLVLAQDQYRSLLAELPPEVEVGDLARLPAVLQGAADDVPTPTADDLMMLIFTSGTSGDPKACRITQAKVAVPGRMLADRFALGPGDTAYVSMPLFHSNAVMAGWAPAVASGATVALAPRFSASQFLPDVRTFGATYANYVGKPLAYVLAQPARSDDRHNPLRIVFGNEANHRDIDAFATRFDCQVIDSYSSSENAIIVRRTPDMPSGALGLPGPEVAVLSPDGSPTAPARFDYQGRLVNSDEAIGELVNITGGGMFAGYYNNPQADAERLRGGMYWSGDLAYRDAAGYVYFAGRTGDWVRVDGENLTTAPIEAVLQRHPAVITAAVYGVPDPEGPGDLLVAAVCARESLSPEGLTHFLSNQADLPRKARPRRLRLMEELPMTPTNKVLKRVLRDDPDQGEALPWPSRSG